MFETTNQMTSDKQNVWGCLSPGDTWWYIQESSWSNWLTAAPYRSLQCHQSPAPLLADVFHRPTSEHIPWLNFHRAHRNSQGELDAGGWLQLVLVVQQILASWCRKVVELGGYHGMNHALLSVCRRFFWDFFGDVLDGFFGRASPRMVLISAETTRPWATCKLRRCGISMATISAPKDLKVSTARWQLFSTDTSQSLK